MMWPLPSQPGVGQLDKEKERQKRAGPACEACAGTAVAPPPKSPQGQRLLLSLQSTASASDGSSHRT